MSELIEPLKSGTELLEEVSQTTVEPGQLALWRLGQAGMLAKFSSATVLIDPYLSNHCEAVLGAPFDHRRMTRAPLDPAEIADVDVVFCTHDHLDHLDIPTMRTLARTPKMVAAAPSVARSILEELGWGSDRIIATEAGGDYFISGLNIRALAVPHDDFDEGPEGAPYQGFILSDGHISFAHLGDARDHNRVRAAVRNRAVDVLAAPINGRDENRAALGFAGNMSAEEAVLFALDVQPGVIIPMHYDMFAQNTDLNALDRFTHSARTKGVPHQVLAVGERAFFKQPQERF